MQQFFDINKFKPGKGILWFPISLARIENAQSAQMYFEEYIPHMNPAKILTPTIGINFCYSDMLYMWDDEKASILKRKFTYQICRHKSHVNKYITKPFLNKHDHTQAAYYIPQAFQFDTRSSLYMQYSGDLSSDLNVLRNIYDKDVLFQKYVAEDCKQMGKELTETQLMFFLEEHLVVYYLAHKKILLRNDYVPQYDWVLLCYPGGKPLKHFIYIMQQDFFKLGTSTNVYQMCEYDLTEKKLYDFSAIDLETYM